MNKVVKFPQVFDSRERLIGEVSKAIMADGRTFRRIAELTGVGTSTIEGIARGSTRWPRATTLFPLLEVLGLSLELRTRRGK